jgi:hypothetical protein
VCANGGATRTLVAISPVQGADGDPGEVNMPARETSKIASHANTKITEEYTIVQLKLKRQEEVTRRVQGRHAKAEKRSQKGMQAVKKADAA